VWYVVYCTLSVRTLRHSLRPYNTAQENTRKVNKLKQDSTDKSAQTLSNELDQKTQVTLKWL